MAFWSSEMLIARNESEGLIAPFDSTQVKHGAYQMRLGDEYFLTSDDPQHKRRLNADGQVVIPPGQFALLLTLETVRVPLDSIALISIRARYKLRGLINVSGFHVDPGFDGCLKFGVYNAGSSQVVIDAGAPMFTIWFCNFVAPTRDKYDGHWQGQNQITADDVMRLQGEVSSPAQLRQDLDELRKDLARVRHGLLWGLGILGSIIAITMATHFVRLFVG